MLFPKMKTLNHLMLRICEIRVSITTIRLSMKIIKRKNNWLDKKRLKFEKVNYNK